MYRLNIHLLLGIDLGGELPHDLGPGGSQNLLWEIGMGKESHTKFAWSYAKAQRKGWVIYL